VFHDEKCVIIFLMNERPHIDIHQKLTFHKNTHSKSDKAAAFIVNIIARSADLFFKHRYGHRAIVLETVAAVPGMVGGMFSHLRSLRTIKDDHGWIQELLDEAENERMHLMVFSHIAKPTRFERVLIVLAQAFMFVTYSLLYMTSRKTAHRTVGYLEEQAIHSYTTYLNLIDSGEIKNTDAPSIAISYWSLPKDAKLRDVVLVVRADEVRHRDVNHTRADSLSKI
jgi:ubiquinol oxidase